MSQTSVDPVADSSDRGKQNDVKGSLKDVGHVGLLNMGNTCYMNSGLQVLLSSKHLVQAIMDSKVYQNSDSDNKTVTKGMMYIAFKELIGASSTDKPNIYKPDKIKNAVSKLNKAFAGYGQQDSFELIQTVLDGLEKETNKAGKVSYESIDTYKKEYHEVQELFRKYHHAKYDSPITRVTCTELAKCVMCTECQSKSYSFSYCQSLLLDLPTKKGKSDGQQKTKNKRQNSYDDILNLSTLIDNSEKAYTVENYYCITCKEHKNVNVREWISEPAKCLIIQFKRFRNDSYGPFSTLYRFIGGYSKNDSPVEYEDSLYIRCIDVGQSGVEQGDMQPDRTSPNSEADSSTDQCTDNIVGHYTDKNGMSCTSQHTSIQNKCDNDNDTVPRVLSPLDTKITNNVDTDKKIKDAKPPKGQSLNRSMAQFSKIYEYRYRGASLHSGGLGGGHYTALCYGCNDKYYYCNDSSVTQVKKDKLDAHAYVLIFDRVD